MSNRRAVLPPSLPPRGISRPEAATYIGVGVTLFDEMVESGSMPPPKRIGTRLVWDVRALDKAFEALPSNDAEPDDPWSKVSAR